MSLRMRDALMRALDEFRYEPTEKRLRVMLGDHTVLDSTRALLVWEPRRMVPSYAAPVEDVRADLVAASDSAPPSEGGVSPDAILHPGIPFSTHSTAGDALSVRAAGETREAAAPRPAAPDLADYVVLDFGAFDAWYEEDGRVVSHPRDPFHRIDILESSRRVRIELDGQVLAESSRPLLLFETGLPVRSHLQPTDLRVSSRENATRS